MRLDPGGDRRHAREPGAAGRADRSESGPLSIWLCRSLTALGLPVICLDALWMPRRRCHSQLNKSDSNDARGLG